MRPALVVAALLMLDASTAFAQYGRAPVGGGGGGGPRVFPVSGRNIPPEVVGAGVLILVGFGVYAIRRWGRGDDELASTAGDVRIRVVSIPPGDAPEDIRRAWVGLVLPIPTSGASTGRTVGVLSGEPEDEPAGFPVDGRVAVEALAKRFPDAAQWWRTHARHVTSAGYQLVFPAEVARLVTEDETLEGERVAAKPLANGKKSCVRCGTVAKRFAVRCRQCKGVFTQAPAENAAPQAERGDAKSS